MVLCEFAILKRVKKSAPRRTASKPAEEEILPQIEEDSASLQQPSFYEKVMGEKPSDKPVLPPSTEENIKEFKPADKGGRKLFLLGSFVFVGTVLITSIVGFSLMKFTSQAPSNQAKNSQPSSTPVPTEVPQIHKEEWDFEVLNGSGVPGAAAKAADKIKALGYTVTNVGNAQTDVDKTEVYISESKNKNDAQIVLKDLEKDFGTLSIKDTFDSSTKTAIRIVLGGE